MLNLTAFCVSKVIRRIWVEFNSTLIKPACKVRDITPTYKVVFESYLIRGGALNTHQSLLD